MRRPRTLWFAVAALCVCLAAGIFAGRTMLSDLLGGGVWYQVLIISAYLLLGGAAGSLTRAFTVSDTGNPG